MGARMQRGTFLQGACTAGRSPLLHAWQGGGTGLVLQLPRVAPRWPALQGGRRPGNRGAGRPGRLASWCCWLICSALIGGSKEEERAGKNGGESSSERRRAALACSWKKEKDQKNGKAAGGGRL